MSTNLPLVPEEATPARLSQADIDRIADALLRRIVPYLPPPAPQPWTPPPYFPQVWCSVVADSKGQQTW